jgi:hypothetical protein
MATKKKIDEVDKLKLSHSGLACSNFAAFM